MINKAEVADKKLRQLKGLGPQSEKLLAQVGITTPHLLHELGPVRAYLRLVQSGISKPSLNFLYALVGAVENRHWLEVAEQEKGRLLLELEGHKEMQALLNAQEHTTNE